MLEPVTPVYIIFHFSQSGTRVTEHYGRYVYIADRTCSVISYHGTTIDCMLVSTPSYVQLFGFSPQIGSP